MNCSESMTKQTPRPTLRGLDARQPFRLDATKAYAAHGPCTEGFAPGDEQRVSEPLCNPWPTVRRLDAATVFAGGSRYVVCACQLFIAASPIFPYSLNGNLGEKCGDRRNTDAQRGRSVPQAGRKNGLPPCSGGEASGLQGWGQLAVQERGHPSLDHRSENQQEGTGVVAYGAVRKYRGR